MGLCLLLKESYPFSHFPMYDKFPDHTYYLYVADKEGNPLPFREFTGHGLTKPRKWYDSELRAIQKRLKEANDYREKVNLTIADRRPAGELVLKKIFANSTEQGKEGWKKHSPVQLFHVWVKMKNAHPIEEPDLVAEVDFTASH